MVAFLVKLQFAYKKKQSMLINNACSSWYYNKVGNIWYHFKIECKDFIWQWCKVSKPTTLLRVRSMALSAMADEYEELILYSNKLQLKSS